MPWGAMHGQASWDEGSPSLPPHPVKGLSASWRSPRPLCLARVAEGRCRGCLVWLFVPEEVPATW